MSQTTISAPQLSGPAQQLDDYLQRQMRKASTQVRLVDLFTSIMTLLAAFLGALFLVALIDAWIFELRPWMRLAVLGTVVVSALAYIVVVVVPLSIRRINPVYAAKVVESARPDIKNGLINYLLLRSYSLEEKAVSQRVIELVGSRAANDISGLEVSGTVDKSNTIRIALLLVVIVTLLGLYKVFSPKDPFQTFARVIAPFADVARPARVRISDVLPGNTTVYFGQPMPVSARISGRFDPDSVYLVYSTTDGQVIDERVSMRPSGSGDGTYVVLLKTDDRGIGHSLNYHIEAGDGESIEYTLLLKSTPMLSIDSITYQPPEYTRLPEQTVTGTSDISAIEGTRVTLRSIANTGLQSAAVELLLQRPDSQFDVVNTVSMEIVESKRAECKFRLQLDNKRQGQRYSHYRLNLVTVEGKQGEPSAPCPIRVIPDLAPEIQVLDPTDTELSVPINSKIRFVIRAQDADFELTKISVAGDSSVYRVFEQEVPLPRDADLSGQINTRFDLWPKKLKMREGETILVAFAAFDNRRIAANDAPDPNRTLTANYVITVTGAIENPPADKPEDNAEQGDNSKSENDSDPNEDGTSPKSDKDEGPKSDPDEKSGNKGEDEEKQGDKQSDKQGDKQDDKQSDKQSDKQGDKQGDKQNDKQNDKQGDKQSTDSTDSSEADKDGKSEGGTPDESKSDESKNGDAKNGDAKNGNGEKSSSDGKGGSDSKPADGGEGGTDPGSNSSGESPTGGNESSANNADPDGTEQPGQSGNNNQPGKPLDDDAHPGDIIEKINQIREQNEKSGKTPEQPEGGDKSESDSTEKESNQGDKSNSGSGNEQTQQNPDKDNQPSNEGSASDSEDAGEKGSNDKSQSSGGSGDKSEDDKKGSSEGGNESGEKPLEQEPNPDDKSGANGGDDQKQKSSGSSGANEEKGNPKQSDPSQPTGDSKGKDGELGKEDQGDSGNPESGGSKQGGTQPGQEGSSSGGSPEPGTETGQQPGSEDGQPSSEPGDQPGSESNGKDSQQPGKSGSSQGDQPGNSTSSQPSEGQSTDSNSSGNQAGDQPGGSGSGNQPGGGNLTGQSSSGNKQNTPQTNSANVADAANLEYTKRATDLALDYLTQQQVNPDPELLEQLNWTEDELRDFVKRWNELKLRAETGDASQKQEFDQMLRSLGLAPNNAEVQQTQVQQDKQDGYQEEGRVSNAPSGFRAFEKRRNRVDKEQPPG